MSLLVRTKPEQKRVGLVHRQQHNIHMDGKNTKLTTHICGPLLHYYKYIDTYVGGVWIERVVATQTQQQMATYSHTGFTTKNTAGRRRRRRRRRCDASEASCAMRYYYFQQSAEAGRRSEYTNTDRSFPPPPVVSHQ